MTGQRLALNYSACSDRGLVRGNNEDSAYAGPRLLALADGMGGHAAGEVASQFLIEALAPLDTPLIDEPEHREKLTTLLATAAEEGNQDISAHVDENPQLEGMGCTLTAILFRGNSAGICHVGDSRAYRLRNGELTQITKDDTFVQSLVDEGKLDASDVSSHPQRSLILKALTGREVEPTLSTMELEAGDRLMLCSDGLSDPVSFDTIREILAGGTPERAATKLVEMALRGGGPDNVTVVVADAVPVDSDDEPIDREVTLPDQPVFAGAVAPETHEYPRQDSPAARAAALGAIVKQSRPGAQRSKLKGADGDPTEDEEGEHPQPRKRRSKAPFIGAGLALLMFLILGVGALIGYQHLKANYFLAEKDGNITINQGVAATVLGVPLEKHVQDVCLDDKASVRLVDANTGGKDCHRFNTSDLRPAARGTLEGMPEDNYENVVGQVRRLASQTLPVCVTREKSPKPGDNTPGQPGQNQPAPNQPTPSPAAPTKATNPNNSTDLSHSAPEDLTTPGVSCREVN